MFNINDTIVNLGARLQEARLLRNMTQEELAIKCDVTPKHISNLERGTSAGSVTLLLSICEILNVTPNTLFIDTFPSNDNSNDNIIPLEKHNIILKYCNLSKNNQKFIDSAIEHLSNEQARIK